MLSVILAFLQNVQNTYPFPMQRGYFLNYNFYFVSIFYFIAVQLGIKGIDVEWTMQHKLFYYCLKARQ